MSTTHSPFDRIGGIPVFAAIAPARAAASEPPIAEAGP
jgi:hypothetical protein